MIVGKDEGRRHLTRALDGVSTWADVVLVYGDGPDAMTRGMIRAHPCVSTIADISQYEKGEHLVRNKLIGMCDKALDVGDMVVVVDADEVIAGTPAAIRHNLESAAKENVRAWNVHFRHIWSPDGKYHRIDGMWQPSVGVRVYRHAPGFQIFPYGEWVCPPVPNHVMQDGRQPILTIDHWGYARAQDRPRKHAIYMKLAGHHPRHIQSIIEEPFLEPVPE